MGDYEPGASRAKVFCVGFQKTGTSSMGAAFKALGYSVVGAQGTRDPHIADNVYDLARRVVPLYDAFEDNPWPVLYEFLDESYENSKFILTVRDADSWLRSIVRHCGNRSTPMREWIYGFGNPIGHETEYGAVYERHNEEVSEYFHGRDDFLVMDLWAGDGWEKLCSFLGFPVMINPFPHLNEAKRSTVFSQLHRIMNRR